MLVFIPWGGEKRSKKQPETLPTKPPNVVGGLRTHEAEKLINLGSTDSLEVVGEYLAIPYLMKALRSNSNPEPTDDLQYLKLKRD